MTLGTEHFKEAQKTLGYGPIPGESVHPIGQKPIDLKKISRQAAQHAERRVLSDVIKKVKWNKTEAARMLNISYKALLYKLEEYGLND